MGRKGTCMYVWEAMERSEWRDKKSNNMGWYDQNNQAKFDKDQTKEKLKRNSHSRVLNTVTN